jgi:hypothetical protein
MHAQTTDIPDLPSLESGLTLLETPDSHGIQALQTLVIDHVLLNDGPAYWVDSGHHAVTSNLRELAPADRVLDRINVARGFTPYQHTSLIRRLRTGLQGSPSLLVVPAVDFHYRSDDLRGVDGEEMLTRGLAEIARISRDHDIPVLLTRERADEFTEPVASLVEHTLEYQSTKYGPRFVQDDGDIETLTYDLGDGWLQTTLAYWAQLLEDRELLYKGRQARKTWGAV